MANAQTVYISSSATNNTICKGDLVTFTASISLAPTRCTGFKYYISQNYTWYVDNIPVFSFGSPSGFSTSNLNDNSKVSFRIANTYSCYKANQNYTEEANSNTVTITVRPNRTELSIIAPVQTQLINRTEYTFSVSSTSIADQFYNWKLPPTIGTIITGQGTTSIKFLTSFDNSTGNINVSSYNKHCYSTSGLNATPLIINVTNLTPTYPQNLKVASYPSATSITLAWQPAADNGSVAGYEVCYRNLVDIEKPYSHVTVAGTTVTLNGLQEGLEYKFFVIAFDDQGMRSDGTIGVQNYNDPKGISVNDYIDKTPPLAPANLMVSEATNTKIALVWNEPYDNVKATAYEITLNGQVIESNYMRTMYVASISTAPNIFVIKAKDARGNISVASSPLNVKKIDALVIDSATGNVGIGVRPPTERLDIEGNLKVRGSIFMDKKVKNEANTISFTGASLDFFSPVQAQWNGNKPVLSLSQFGEINFYSSPFLNYNSILLKGTGDYKNGLSYADSFGTTSGIGGSVLFGENGGALGSRLGIGSSEKVALTWDKNNNVKLNGNLTIGGLLFSPSGKIVNLDMMSNFLKNYTQTEIVTTVDAGYSATYANTNIFSYGENGHPNGIIGIISTPIYATRSVVVNNMDWQIIGGISNGQIKTCYDSSTTMIKETKFIANPISSGRVDRVSVNIPYTQTKTCIGLMKTKVLADIIGIGTSTPGAALDVKGDARITGDLYINGVKVNAILSNAWQVINNTLTYQGNTNLKGNVKIEGHIGAKDFCVNATGAWCDYVFDKDYQKMSLNELKQFVKEHKFYPSIGSGITIEKNGFEVSKMFAAQMKMQEEHLLYTFDLYDKLETIESETIKELLLKNKRLENNYVKLENRLKEIEKRMFKK